MGSMGGGDVLWWIVDASLFPRFAKISYSRRKTPEVKYSTNKCVPNLTGSIFSI